MFFESTITTNLTEYKVITFNFYSLIDFMLFLY